MRLQHQPSGVRQFADRSLQSLTFSEDLRIDPRDFVRLTVRKAF